MNEIRVLLADAVALFRSGLRALLSAAPGLAIVGEAVDGAQAVRLAERQLGVTQRTQAALRGRELGLL